VRPLSCGGASCLFFDRRRACRVSGTRRLHLPRGGGILPPHHPAWFKPPPK